VARALIATCCMHPSGRSGEAASLVSVTLHGRRCLPLSTACRRSSEQATSRAALLPNVPLRSLDAGRIVISHGGFCARLRFVSREPRTLAAVGCGSSFIVPVDAHRPLNKASMNLAAPALWPLVAKTSF